METTCEAQGSQKWRNKKPCGSHDSQFHQHLTNLGHLGQRYTCKQIIDILNTNALEKFCDLSSPWKLSVSKSLLTNLCKIIFQEYRLSMVCSLYQGSKKRNNEGVSKISEGGERELVKLVKVGSIKVGIVEGEELGGGEESGGAGKDSSC